MREFHEKKKVFCWAEEVQSGWYDPLIQNEAYVTFATNAPGYGQLQNDTVLQQLNQAFFGPGGCQEQEEACYAAGDSEASNKICRQADAFCVCYDSVNLDFVTYLKKIFFKVDNVFVPAVGDRDSDDLRQNSSALFPPEFYVDFLHQASIQKKIGAEVRYHECPDAPFELFVKTGDVCFYMRYLRCQVNLTKTCNAGCQNISSSVRKSCKLWAQDTYLGAST